MSFAYSRVIRFSDTDAAGVVYFAQILSICHEAYEESLHQAGIDTASFFSPGAIAVPITHAEADFRRPLRCGNAVTVELQPTQIADTSFEVAYTIAVVPEKPAAIALTRHVCIATATRQRHPLTPELTHWLRSSAASGPVPTDAAPLD